MGYYAGLQVFVVETQVGLLLEFGGLEQMPNLNLISWLLAVVCLKPNDSQKVSFSWKFSRKFLFFWQVWNNSSNGYEKCHCEFLIVYK